MSISFRDQQAITTPAEHARRFFTSIFASAIQNTRKAAGRSIPDAARLAGMELSEWMALEAGGLLPQTSEQLSAIAGALEVDYDWMANWVVLCWSAWEG